MMINVAVFGNHNMYEPIETAGHYTYSNVLSVSQQ